MSHTKLFIPGPVECHPEILKGMATPMIGHRAPEFSVLYGRMQPRLQEVLYTKNRVFLAGCSATGIMEGSVRNCVAKACLNVSCGAFSDRWHEITRMNNRKCDSLAAEWGLANHPEDIDKALSSGKYDAVTIVHNETSTGVMNPLAGICEMIHRKYPDVQILVDSVSSMCGVKIETDKLGIDVLLAGTQKAWGLPPGMTVFAVSERALERSKTIPDTGYYFNFPEFAKYHEKQQTPTTPPLSHLFALDVQLERIMKEGLDNRWSRHLKMQKMCHDWVKKNGFGFFAEKGYESVTLTTVANNKGINVGELNKYLKTKGVVIANGYGKAKDKSFRIAHMADCQPEDLQQVLGWIDEFLAKL